MSIKVKTGFELEPDIEDNVMTAREKRELDRALDRVLTMLDHDISEHGTDFTKSAHTRLLDDYNALDAFRWRLNRAKKVVLTEEVW